MPKTKKMGLSDRELRKLLAEPVEPRPLSEKEQHWAEFVRNLTPWQFHKLIIEGELELHDAYISGEKELLDIFILICVQGEEEDFKAHLTRV